MDGISNFIAGVVKSFWDFIALCFMCAGIGGAMAAIAMAYAGYFASGALFIVLPLCGALVWAAGNQRKKYLKWVRVGDGSTG